MGLGQGSIVVNQKKEAGGGGGAVNGAVNGVSLSGTDVVLGDNFGALLAQLTSPRSVFMNGQEIVFYQGGSELAEAYFQIDGIAASDLMEMTFYTGTNAGGQLSEFYYLLSQIFLNHNNGIATSNFTLNNTDVIATHNDGAGNYGTLQLNGTHSRLLHTELIELNNGVGNTFLEIDLINDLYRMGDLNATGNATKILVKDASSSFEVVADNIIDFADTSGNKSFLVDLTSGLYQLGDIDGAGNQTYLSINDSLFLIELLSRQVYSDNRNFRITNSTGSTNAFPFVRMDFAGSNLFVIDPTNGRYEIGDIDITANATKITINDTAQTILLQANNGVTVTEAAFLLHTAQAMTNYAAAAAGTLTNAPTAGNPAVWVGLDINGTTYAIPAWAV